MDAIQPYVKSEQIFNCPSHTHPAWSGGAYKFRSGNQYGSYSINSTYYNAGDFEQSPAGEKNTSLAAIGDAAGCVWVGDSSGYFEFAWADISNQEVVEVDSSGLRYLEYLAERHPASTVVLFCDGHIKSMRLDVLARKNAAGAYPAFTIQDDDA